MGRKKGSQKWQCLLEEVDYTYCQNTYREAAGRRKDGRATTAGKTQKTDMIRKLTPK